MIDSESKKAIDLAVEAGLPFVCFALPGSSRPQFFSDPSLVDGSEQSVVLQPFSSQSFLIGEWLKPFAERIELRPIWDAERTVAECGMRLASGTFFSVDSQSFTPVEASKEEYISSVNAIIANCRKRNGKTVFSRVMEGTSAGLAISEAADRLFSEFPETFRNIYFTPATGLWMGATPELLLSYDGKARRLDTMAFAGTRRVNALAAAGGFVAEDEEWDAKNLREHQFVLDYIVNELERLGLVCQVGEAHSVRYGVVEHLCHNISANVEPEMVEAAIDAINPTPALCGFPKSDAIADINHFERHPRGCYGGFVAVADGENLRAFVNLRCVSLSAGNYRIYGGGGITGDSSAEEEYRETVAKTAFLRSLLGRSDFNC